MITEIQIAKDEPRFSWITGLAARTAKPSYDRIVRETENFVVLPSLGSLVPGWMLIIPKREIDNFSYLNEDEVQELRVLLPDMLKSAGEFPGHPYIFEHGSKRGSSLACGVDQAHLHVVPLEFDLCKIVTGGPEVSWNTLANAYSLFGEASPQEYLFISDFFKRSYRGFLRSDVSQWFRRVIAAEVGKSSEWNYREYPQLENLERTWDVLGNMNVSGQ